MDSAKDAVDVFNQHEPELESAAREFMDTGPPVTVGLSFKKISDQQISLALD
jgi:hypothetical protein